MIAYLKHDSFRPHYVLNRFVEGGCLLKKGLWSSMELWFKRNFQLVYIKFVYARFDSVRSGPVRFGRFGSIRLRVFGSIQSSSVRFGSGEVV